MLLWMHCYVLYIQFLWTCNCVIMCLISSSLELHLAQLIGCILHVATLHESWCNEVSDMQQLCIFGGLLTIGAIINSSPLRTVAYVAKVGTVWNAVGWSVLFTPLWASTIHESCLDIAITQFIAMHMQCWARLQRSVQSLDKAERITHHLSPCRNHQCVHLLSNV